MLYVVKVGGKVGNLDVTIEGSFSHVSADGGAKLALKMALAEMAEAILESNVPMSAPVSIYKQITVEGGELVATKQGTEWRYKLHVGAWKKFGIAVYPEVLNDAQIGYLQLHGSFEMTGYRAIVDMKDDSSPKRVARFEKVAE